MQLNIELQFSTLEKTLPHQTQIKSWVGAVFSTLPPLSKNCELNIRIVDIEEITELNRTYRQKDRPTNVLAFAYNLEIEADNSIALGDVVICAPVVSKEAKEQGIELLAHWAHMVIHGTLHLLGYDHYEDEEAKLMESLENKILTELGFEPPYKE